MSFFSIILYFYKCWKSFLYWKFLDSKEDQVFKREVFENEDFEESGPGEEKYAVSMI